MGPPWFLLPYHLFLPNMNETCQHPGKVCVRRNGPHPSGEGRGRQVGCSVPAHIPQERGGARSGQRSNLKDYLRFLQNPDIMHKAPQQKWRRYLPTSPKIRQLYHLGTSSINCARRVTQSLPWVMCFQKSNLKTEKGNKFAPFWCDRTRAARSVTRTIP